MKDTAILCWDEKHKDFGRHTHAGLPMDETFKYIPAADRPVSVPLSLLERLVGDDPADSEEGYCFFCGQLGYFGEPEQVCRGTYSVTVWHFPDCAYLEARKLIEEAKG